MKTTMSKRFYVLQTLANRSHLNFLIPIFITFNVLVHALSGCGAREDTGTETHWLKACDSNADCGGPTSCLCGACTITCETDQNCPLQASACVSQDQNVCSSALAICLGHESSLVEAGTDASGEQSSIQFVAPPVSLATRPMTDENPCDDAGWCWANPHAPGERFSAFSDDGKYAVGSYGVVFDTSGVYLPRPSTTHLTTVVTREQSLWVGGEGGVWQKTADGWEQLAEEWVQTLAVTPSGQLWAITLDTLMRWDGLVWNDVMLPRSSGNGYSLHDLEALPNGDIWVLGGYWKGRVPEGTLYTLVHDEWREYPANRATGNPMFLAGADTPYVYNATDAGDNVANVFDPQRDWAIVGSAQVQFPGALLWGPDRRVWWADEQKLTTFDAIDAPRSAEFGCVSAVTWDDDTMLCAAGKGGLTYIDVTADGYITSLSGGVEVTSYDATTFGTVPTPVWAQTAEAWAAAADDVWRAPLEHFDGRRWTDHRGADDTFWAHTIDGTAGNNVWFAATNGVRHWNGDKVSIFELPFAEEGSEVMSLRAAGPDDVWVLRRVLQPSIALEVWRFDGSVWQVSYSSERDEDVGITASGGVVRAAGAIVGTSENLWAAFGHTVLHFDGATWSAQARVDGIEESGLLSARVLHAATDDDGGLWLLTETTVYQWLNGELMVKGYSTPNLDHIAVTRDAVWNFEAKFHRRLPR
jgi:hypothetical protein